MAKLIEELIVIKLSRMVRDNDKDTDVIEAAQRKLIEYCGIRATMKK